MEKYLEKNFSLPGKNSSPEVLKRWRQAVSIVKNPKRRFRNVADLKKRKEAEENKKKIKVKENKVQSLRNMVEQLKSRCSCHARSSRKMSSNSESLDLKAESFNTIECTAENLAGLEVNGKSPILDTTGCKLSIPSVTPCDLQVLDQEGSGVLTPDMDRNIISDAMENDRSQLLLGSQELPASDVKRSNRCQALCANGEKKHLNVGKVRRTLFPALTMPVKEVGAFDMEDDNPKGVNSTQRGKGGNYPQVYGCVSAGTGGRNNFGIQVEVGRGGNLNLENHYYDQTRSCPVSLSPIDCFNLCGTVDIDRLTRSVQKRRGKENDDVCI